MELQQQEVGVCVDAYVTECVSPNNSFYLIDENSMKPTMSWCYIIRAVFSPGAQSNVRENHSV